MKGYEMIRYEMIGYCAIVGLLFLGFAIFFCRIRWLEMLSRLWKRTRADMDEVSRRRLLENRRRLLAMQREHTIWYRLEQQLNYSGWKRYFPLLTAEVWILGNIVLVTLVFSAGLLITRNGLWSMVFVLGVIGVEYGALLLCKVREMRAVNENLLKFLNFLGNYSITAGEVTGIFNQVSRYVDEPLKSALLECCYEAQTTGDAGQALLSMAEKIEHPKFQELARNIEVSVRYSADFSALVAGSRRSVREYLRQNEERKGMLREAVINMVLLLGMSLFALITVDGLINTSIWDIVWYSLPGRIAVGVVAVIIGLLVRQLCRISK